jgi:hypothetical protein
MAQRKKRMNTKNQSKEKCRAKPPASRSPALRNGTKPMLKPLQRWRNTKRDFLRYMKLMENFIIKFLIPYREGKYLLSTPLLGQHRGLIMDGK